METEDTEFETELPASSAYLQRKAEFLAKIDALVERVQSEVFVEVMLSEVLPCAPSYLGLGEPEYEAVGELSSCLANRRVETYPRLGRSTAHRSLSNAIILFPEQGGLDASDKRLKSVLLLIKLGVCVAKADSVIDDTERAVILKSIEQTPRLSTAEVSYLKAAAVHIMSEGVNRDLILHKLEDLRPDLKDAVLELVMSVALADGEIAKGEISVIQDFYRVLGLNPRLVRGALNNFAREHHLDVSNAKVDDVDFDKIFEDEVTLDELLDEFSF